LFPVADPKSGSYEQCQHSGMKQERHREVCAMDGIASEVAEEAWQWRFHSLGPLCGDKAQTGPGHRPSLRIKISLKPSPELWPRKNVQFAGNHDEISDVFVRV
jgi:hypothetical protein